MNTAKHLKLQHSPRAAKTCQAFTLLEVILAVSIAGALLAAAATLVVSVADVWMERQDRHFYEDHVDGVVEFLQASFTAAGTEITSESSSSSDTSSDETDDSIELEASTGVSSDEDQERSNNTDSDSSTSSALISVAEDPIDWAKPPGFADYQDPLIHFTLKDKPPLLVQTDNAPVVSVEVYLYFEADEGLSLLWYTPLQEESEDLSDLRRTPISDLIKKIEYIYWDESFERWETETEAKEGDGDDEFILPRFLKLTFEYEGETKERTVTIPVPSRSVLLF
jgi:prepilin-type N-terminal cleavage/methylation domain-containing protein